VLRGMLYKVSGRETVEIVLPSGERFRLGTDEPELLAQAILHGRSGVRPA
jgi:hypothetical protein